MTNQDKEPASIMIVDDEPANLSVLECLLIQEGYRVRAGASQARWRVSSRVCIRPTCQS